MNAETDSQSPSNPFESILTNSRLIVCCGPGGVGKTTVAATAGLEAARRGRDVAVLTIDPARRLADSLGLEQLDNDPSRVDLSTLNSGSEGGLWALMLDERATFRDMILEHVPDRSAMERSQNNKIYQILTSAFHGMEHYLALEKLYRLYTDRRFDLVILDTPPTKNAIDFLETPKRASRFFDQRVIKWFLPDDAKSKGFFSRWFSAGSMVQSLLSRLVGEAFVEEIVEFFGTFQYLRQTFKERGEVIEVILEDEDTSFVAVTSPEPRRIREAEFFAEQLEEFGLELASFLINGLSPDFGQIDLEELNLETFEAIVSELLDRSVDKSQTRQLYSELVEHYGSLVERSRRDRESVRTLAEDVGRDRLHVVPMLSRDIHDLSGLAELADFLGGTPVELRN